jgi:catechol 2,3-dioxygenase-like lactoylglutathione lyase family enzyme
MNIEFQGNSRICYTVQNYDECLSFYEDTLCLKAVNQWDRSADDKGVVYLVGQIELELLKGNTNPTANNGEYLYIQVKNVNDVYAKLKDVAPVITPISDQTWGHRNFMIKDPAGIALKFFSLIN